MKRAQIVGLALALVGSTVVAASAATRPYLDVERNLGGIGNQKALRVGDIVTVIVMESASGTTAAKSDTKSTTEISGGPGLGILGQISPWGIDAENKFKGDGRSTRTGALSAEIGTTVVEELPNGNLRLLGERTVEINGEQQIITLTGVIRPQDVSADNTVVSNVIAEAQISYSGDGPVNDVQSPGLLSRIAGFLF